MAEEKEKCGVTRRVFLIVFAGIWISGVASTTWVAIGNLWNESRIFYTYRPTRARTVQYDDKGKEGGTCGRARFEYVVGKEAYEATCHVHKDGVTWFDENRRKRVKPLVYGEFITIWYDPEAPAEYTFSPVPGAFMLGMLMFMMPFIGISFVLLWAATINPSLGMDDAKESQWFGIYTGLSCFGAIVFLGVQLVLSRETAFYLGAGLIVGGIPLLTLIIHSLLKGRKEAADMGRDALCGKVAGELREITEDSIPDPEGRLGCVLGLTAFSVFWCSIVAIGLYGGVIQPVWQYATADGNHGTTQGAIVASEVRVGTDEDGTTYTPFISYAYEVDGKKYMAHKVGFATMGSSNKRVAQKVVGRFPVGRNVTVYYRFDDPEKAILELTFPIDVICVALFLQPFLIIGIGLPFFALRMGKALVMDRDFVRAPVRVPLDLPYWGRLEEKGGQYMVARPSSRFGRLGGFVVGYGATCFVAIFVVAFGFGGIGVPAAVASIVAFAVAAGAGLALAFLKREKRLHIGQFSINERSRTVEFGGKAVSYNVGFDEIRHWAFTTVEEQDSEDGLRYVPLIGFVTNGGDFTPVHYYNFNAGEVAVGMKTALVLSRLTDHRVYEIDCPSEYIDSDVAPSIKGIRRAWRERNRGKGRLYEFG